MKNGPHIRARCRPAGTLAQDIAIHNMEHHTPSAPATSTTKPIKCEEEDNLDWQNVTANPPHESSADGFHGAIISIGPETDAVIDHFNLDDNLVPHLRVLTRQVRSSRWEAVLRTPQWGLSYEQSANLARAMRADICGRQDRDIQVWFSLTRFSLLTDFDQVSLSSMSFGVKFSLLLLVFAVTLAFFY
jgi:hypothetical protein